jgi:hypothetical protein
MNRTTDRKSPKLPLSAVALATLVTLGGCAAGMQGTGVGKDEYRTLFSDVIRKSLDAQPRNNVCLPPLFGFGETATPSVEVAVDAEFNPPALVPGRAAQFKALESVGLVSGVEGERTVNGKVQKYVTYRRTATGASSFSGVTFCYAKATLDRVVKWKGPVALGDYKAAFVYYTVKTSGIADWARAPAVIAAFPAVASIVNGEPAKERQIVLDLSSDGWDVAEYSKLLQLQ